jgi:diguanylate cyclase (GGDEF)-like protein
VSAERDFPAGRTDALTGLPERAQLRRAISDALGAGSKGDLLTVAVVGLDRFSGVNAALGRPAGNDVLRTVADRLRQLGGTTARLGGDEFAVVLTGARALDVGDAVSDAIAQPIDVADRSIFLSASIGIACAPDDADDAETLLQHADTAMQVAKDRGGALALRFAGDLRAHVEERLAIASDLQRAVERDELVVHYQPIVETATRRVVGMEALVRWQHPTLGLIGPDRFIPVAEDTGLIVPIGNWVLHEACAHAARWQRITPLRVAVNLSPRQFEHERVDEVVVEALRASGLEPQFLEVELTERAVLHDDSVVVEMLQRLRDFGVGCAVDDFGTGYGGISHLIRFPIAQLKIDRSFVQRIELDHDNAVIVASLIELARALGMDVVAEGVESQGQAEFLARHGCAHFQGYLVSKPLSAANFEQLVSRGAAAEAERPRPRRISTHPTPLRPGTRRSGSRRLPAIAFGAAGAVLALTGPAAALPVYGQQTIAAVVRHIESVLPGLGPDEVPVATTPSTTASSDPDTTPSAASPRPASSPAAPAHDVAAAPHASDATASTDARTHEPAVPPSAGPSVSEGSTKAARPTTPSAAHPTPPSTAPEVPTTLPTPPTTIPQPAADAQDSAGTRAPTDAGASSSESSSSQPTGLGR